MASTQNVLILRDIVQMEIRSNVIFVGTRNDRFQGSTRDIYLIKYDYTTKILELYFTNYVVQIHFDIPDIIHKFVGFYKLAFNRNQQMVAINLSKLGFCKLTANVITLHFQNGQHTEIALEQNSIENFNRICELYEMLL